MQRRVGSGTSGRVLLTYYCQTRGQREAVANVRRWLVEKDFHVVDEALEAERLALSRFGWLDRQFCKVSGLCNKVGLPNITELDADGPCCSRAMA